jgi:hypothetical protein
LTSPERLTQNMRASLDLYKNNTQAPLGLPSREMWPV